VVRTTPIALFLREHVGAWSSLAAAEDDEAEGTAMTSTQARAVLDALKSRGALFAHELAGCCGLSEPDVRQALGELVSAGLAASDGFAGVRGLIADRDTNPRESQTAGRWAILNRVVRHEGSLQPVETTGLPEAAVETQARTLLMRYGVVCRRLLAREGNAQPWRALARVYRRLEARGEIRGGRFITGLSGEQFALPEAVERLRETRRKSPDDKLMVLSAADPLNLAGVITAGDRVPAVASTRIVYRNGVPLAAMEGDYIKPLATIDPSTASDVASALAGRRVPPVISGFVGRVS